MNPVAFSIGPLEIRWYSICILTGIIVAYLLAKHESKKFNYEKDFIFDLAFYVVIFGILGARLYYVLFNFKYYANDFLEIFKIWNGGLAIHGGIIAGLITLIVYCKLKKVDILRTTDLISISLLLAQAIGRWGNFFNSEAHGPITTLSNLQNMKFIPSFVIQGMKLDNVYYHPTFFYESLWCFIGTIFLLIIRRYLKDLKKGQLTCLYFIWYGIGRFFIEALRTDSLMIGNLKMAQVFSIMSIVFGLIFLIYLFIKRDGELYYGKENSK